MRQVEWKMVVLKSALLNRTQCVKGKLASSLAPGEGERTACNLTSVECIAICEAIEFHDQAIWRLTAEKKESSVIKFGNLGPLGLFEECKAWICREFQHRIYGVFMFVSLSWSTSTRPMKINILTAMLSSMEKRMKLKIDTNVEGQAISISALLHEIH